MKPAAQKARCCGPAANNPDATNDATPPSAPVARDTIYTCPMHPQIRRSGPGNCPLCGMALEPEGIPDVDESSPELKDMTRRFVIGAIFATPIFVLEMGGHLRGLTIDQYVT